MLPSLSLSIIASYIGARWERCWVVMFIYMLHTTRHAFATSPLQPQLNLNLQDSPVVQFSTTWHQLGPFQIGTRETEWGSDPLERLGGFPILHPDDESSFRSSLAKNGTVSWSKTTAVHEDGVARISISFPDVDWQMMQSAYGWAGLQFQAWIRGYLHIAPSSSSNECIVALHTKQVQELWLDEDHYFGGDVYGYERAPIIVPVPKSPRRYVVNIRVFNDIRMFGGRSPPQVDVELKFDYGCDNLSIDVEKSIFPDIVRGRPSGRVASIPARNNGKHDIEILKIESTNEFVSIGFSDIVVLAPGQTRPLKMSFDVTSSIKGFKLRLVYRRRGYEKTEIESQIELQVSPNDHTALKYTYLHPSGIVSFGIIRPPPIHICDKIGPDLPILLALHGAGVDTNSRMSRNSFDGLPNLCAWVIIPSGVTPWSGDDWHTWGLADAEAAIAAVPFWIEVTSWEGPGVDITKWFISGHSNGGQGAWYTLIHRNDRAIGGAPISGYLSIPGYVPYQLWQELEPRVGNMIQSSLGFFRLDLLVKNLAGTPIFQEHGEKDENVPVYHSRRMFELLQDTVAVETAGNNGYIELPGAGHWFDGIMTFGTLGTFLTDFFQKIRDFPPLPKNFTIVVANPGAMGSRGGIAVLQLLDPSTYGVLEVFTKQREDGWVWSMASRNIRRLEIDMDAVAMRGHHWPITVVLDTQSFTTPATGKLSLLRTRDEWTAEVGNAAHQAWAAHERCGPLLGGLQAIFNTRDTFTILFDSSSSAGPDFMEKALEISNNLFQYYSADTEIIDTANFQGKVPGNLIVLGRIDPKYISPNFAGKFPLKQAADGSIIISLRTGVDRTEKTYSQRPGIGIITTFPAENGRLGIFLWGSDADGLRRATRLFPIRTGVGQPDLIVVGPESGWKGAAGALALGMFDSEWQLTESSYFR